MGSMVKTKLVLYVNGFSMTPADDHAQTTSTIWSPFTLVDRCDVKAETPALWSVFKITVLRPADASCVYFATCGPDAKSERDLWIAEISKAVSHVTMSLFPPHAIAVQPVPWEPGTHTRIMAGYLLRCAGSDHIALIYGELHAYAGGEAKLTMYQDEWCDAEVASCRLKNRTVIGTHGSTNVFSVDNCYFCARALEEKELWLRAVSNVKVKLMYSAPDPTDEDLAVFRDAVRERLDTFANNLQQCREQRWQAGDVPAPLLVQMHRAPDVAAATGDILIPPDFDADEDDAEAPPAQADLARRAVELRSRTNEEELAKPKKRTQHAL